MYYTLNTISLFLLAGFVTAVCPIGRPEELHSTGWMMHKGFAFDGEEYYSRMPSECLSEDRSKLKDGHGGECQFRYASVPDVVDHSWESAPNLSQVGFLERWSLPNYNLYLRFTYFQTVLYIPTSETLDEIAITMKDVNDGAVVRVFNLKYPNGVEIEESRFTFQEPPKTTMLHPYLTYGQNHIVIIHVNDCRGRVLRHALLKSHNRLIAAELCEGMSGSNRVACNDGSEVCLEGYSQVYERREYILGDTADFQNKCCIPMSIGRSEELHYTGWMMHKGFDVNGGKYYGMMPRECLSEDSSELVDGHGGECQFRYSSVPDQTDTAWESAPDIAQIGFLEQWFLANCVLNLRFTYFQTVLFIPVSETLGEIAITIKEVDDGAIVRIFNTKYPNGVEVEESRIKYQEPPKTAQLHQYLTHGQNRIVIIHVDDCQRRVLEYAVPMKSNRAIAVTPREVRG